MSVNCAVAARALFSVWGHKAHFGQPANTPASQQPVSSILSESPPVPEILQRRGLMVDWPHSERSEAGMEVTLGDSL